jgi:DNA repair protein RadC
MKTALEMLAVSMILCHNHPSGNLSPSDADLKITRKIKEAGNTMDIKVLDHVIVTQHGYYSFADEGVI